MPYHTLSPRHVLALPIVSTMSDPTGPSSCHRGRSICGFRGSNGNHIISNGWNSNVSRPYVLPMTASATLSTSATHQPVVRPPGAAKLESIDFNPNASSALTPVVIMHGLLGNSRNFQGWGSKLVKVRRRCLRGLDLRIHWLLCRYIPTLGWFCCGREVEDKSKRPENSSHTLTPITRDWSSGLGL